MCFRCDSGTTCHSLEITAKANHKHPINSLWTKSRPTLIFSCSRSLFTQFYRNFCFMPTINLSKGLLEQPLCQLCTYDPLKCCLRRQFTRFLKSICLPLRVCVLWYQDHFDLEICCKIPSFLNLWEGFWHFNVPLTFFDPQDLFFHCADIFIILMLTDGKTEHVRLCFYMTWSGFTMIPGSDVMCASLATTLQLKIVNIFNQFCLFWRFLYNKSHHRWQLWLTTKTFKYYLNIVILSLYFNHYKHK